MSWKNDYYPPIRLIQVIVEPSAADDDLIGRALRIFKERIARRCGATTTVREANFTLTVSVDPSIGTDGFRISGDENAVHIAGSGPRAVLYGLGKYLHTSAYSADGFHPSRWQGTSVPTSPFRAIQPDTHFCNFYHMAPEHELREYVEDLALWGINYMEIVFPFIDLRSWEDPEVVRITGQIRILCHAARELGIKFGMEVVPNQDFVDQNLAIRADECPGRPGGKNGHNICPNKPGAMEYILNHTYGRVFRHLKKNDDELAAYGVGGKIANPNADLDVARQTRDLLRGVDRKLDMWAKKAWRWRILLIRGELDLLRYTCAKEKVDPQNPQLNWTQVMKGCEAAKPFFTELTQIYHSNLDYNNQTHPHYHYVRPQIMDI